MSGGTVSAGAGGAAGSQGVPAAAGAGAAAGSGIFLMSGSTTTFDVTNTMTISDDIADDSATSLPGGTYSAGNGNGAAITKTGTGLLVLSGTNTFTGGTTVMDGTVQVDGAIEAVTINGGTLGGVGNVGDVQLNTGATGGSIGPGDSPGTLHLHSLKWKGAGASTHSGVKFQLGDSSSAGNSDLMQMAGALTKDTSGGSFYNFHFSDGTGAPTPGATYTLATFSTMSNFSPTDFHFDYTGAMGTLTGTFSMVNNDPATIKPPNLVPPNALMFHVTSGTPVRLQSFEVE
jgi:autotransporter-associated beta strand protein